MAQLQRQKTEGTEADLCGQQVPEGQHPGAKKAMGKRQCKGSGLAGGPMALPHGSCIKEPESGAADHPTTPIHASNPQRLGAELPALLH